ncbi:vWA domain-containing protein [Fusobacterium sp. PH5-44]|uniref:vWA domain-containing protein n=1 Tax=unclassified Fusobacterium TaxID=2648384 RepID=UPI003D228C94
MELGNKSDIYFIAVPLLVIMFMLLGYVKKSNILNSLKLKKRSSIEKMKIILITLGSLLAFLALLSPEKLLNEADKEVKGMNVYVLIDVSRSMMAEDVYPNRLEGAKRLLSTILDNMKGDRIGFIPYSDSAYIQMPLTDDYSIGRNYINAIDSDLISGGGTNLLQGLVIANKSFEEIVSENKTILIISDGGDFENESMEFARNNGLNIYAVGIGTSVGGIVQEYSDGKKVGFIKDDSGSPVISKLNTNFLKEIAKENGGKYYEVNNLDNNFNEFFTDITNIERKSIREEKVKEYKKYFQLPLGLGILLIVIGFLLKGRIKDEE